MYKTSLTDGGGFDERVLRIVNQRALAVLVGTAVAFILVGLYIGLYLTAQPGTAVASADSHDQNWQHKTTWIVPANTLVHVTLYQYDGASGLRNPFLSQATGTVGGTFDVNGKTTTAINPNDPSHIFAIPALGLSVPLPGVSDDAKNPCSNAPCTLSQDHETVTFTFRTGAAGVYRWQCFVPCAAGYIQGFGGPMQTVGYMDGFLKVV
jgi:hypothetical protein